MDRGAWQGTVHRVTESWTQLSAEDTVTLQDLQTQVTEGRLALARSFSHFALASVTLISLWALAQCSLGILPSFSEEVQVMWYTM